LKKTHSFFLAKGLAMQIDCDWRALSRRDDAAHSRFPLLARFVGKFVHDILPAALASVIGGFLFTQYHFGRDQLGRAVPPPAEQMSPASAEVLALVRDEHKAVIDYLKAQMAAEKSRLAAQDADTARAVADAKAAQEKDAREKAAAEQAAAEIKLAEMTPARRVEANTAANTTAAKVALPRPKPATALEVAPAQVAVAQAEPIPQQSAAPAPADRLARDPDSLLAKTLDLKDQVVAATKQAVAALGDMFASVGERIGGATAPSATTPSARPFSSDS
jgi:hypothetical protein